MEVRQRAVKNTSNGSDTLKDSSAKKQTLTKTGMKHRDNFRRIGRIFLLIFLVLYVIFPLLIHYSSTVQTNLIFLSMIRWPLFIDLNKPELSGLPNTRNFYIETEENLKLGAWHVLPSSLENTTITGNVTKFYENSLKDGLPVILYLHGNSGTRGGRHRVQLYQVLRKLNYHVVTFDYRGYADSTNQIPSEEGVVRDAKFVYEWLKRRVGNSTVIIWGHSLGTGVATSLLKELCTQENAASGLILEAPFNNLRDEVKHHPLTAIYRYLPYFEEIFLDALERTIKFASDKSIAFATVPILILHAEDDAIIPINLARLLYRNALQNRPPDSPPVLFHTFDSEHGYGHRYICRAPDLPEIVRGFIQNNCERRNE